MGKPRIEDVAAHAGTSAITVSRVLRAPDKVAPATRARVQAAIEVLGYIPNLAASGLASRRSGVVALLVPTIANSIFAETVQGVADAIRPAGLQLLLGDFGYSEASERELLRALAGRQPEALIVVGVVRDPALRRLLAGLGIPVIETWDLTDDPIDTVIGFSNEVAGYLAARHLLGGGCRHIGFAGGTDGRARHRLHGFTAALAEAGQTLAAETSVHALSIAEGRAALEALLGQAPALDGAFFSTDVLAIGALLEAARRGIAVPARLALVGLGDLEIGRETSPTLTTVQVPAYAIGQRAGEVVVRRLAGRRDSEPVIDLGLVLIARESSVSCRASLLDPCDAPKLDLG
jgi:LacI family gluconate utilization system Gnt-I transcriptional repressor